MKNINNKLQVLKLISNNRRTVYGETYCPMSQTDMAGILGMSHQSIHYAIKNLINAGLLAPRQHAVRKYVITDKGRELVKSTSHN